MIPILFEANETAFTSQGLGALADAVSCSVARVVNGKDELTMVYPSEGLRYADLANDRIIYAQPEYRKSAQPYQIYKITKPLNGKVTVYARHVGSQRTQYIPVTQFSAGSLTETLNSLPNHLAESSPFTFWTNKTVTANFNLTRPASLGKVLGGMEGSILDVYGGEYEFDGYTIKLWNRRGHDSGVELRYGKNITDIEHSEDFASIVTGVVPYWEGMDGTVVSLPEVVVEGQYADTYSFRRTIVKDFSDRFDEQPTQEQLRAAATSYVNQSGIGTPNVNLKVSFEHLAQYTGYENLQLLEQLNLGDTVSIYYEPLNVSASARIAKTVYDCLNDKYTSVQIGSVRSDMEQVLHQVTNETAQAVERVQKDIPSALVEAVENATDLITGANGGFVVIDRDANGKPYQLLIMDTDNKATATNVIRINQNGIGFSTSGYSGPFTTAWTIDGNFVADFITTGVLNAALAKIGLLSDAAGKNSWNLETGALTITDGSLHITTSSETYDVIQLNSGGWHNELSPLQVFLTNDGSDTAMAVQAGGIFGYTPYADESTRKRKFSLSAATGNLLQFDDNDIRRQALGNDGTLRQYDGNDKLRTYLEYGDIMLYTSAEKQAAKLSGAAFTTGGSLQLSDTSAVERARMTIGGLSFYDTTGAHELSALGYQVGGGGVWLSNTSGNPVAQLRAYYAANGYGLLQLFDGSSSTVRAQLDQSGLKFYNSSGGVTSTYPAAPTATSVSSSYASTLQFTRVGNTVTMFIDGPKSLVANGLRDLGVIIPAGYRPYAYGAFIAYDVPGQIRIFVFTSGQIQIYNYTANTGTMNITTTFTWGAL